MENQKIKETVFFLVETQEKKIKLIDDNNIIEVFKKFNIIEFNNIKLLNVFLNKCNQYINQIIEPLEIVRFIIAKIIVTFSFENVEILIYPKNGRKLVKNTQINCIKSGAIKLIYPEDKIKQSTISNGIFFKYKDTEFFFLTQKKETTVEYFSLVSDPNGLVLKNSEFKAYEFYEESEDSSVYGFIQKSITGNRLIIKFCYYDEFYKDSCLLFLKKKFLCEEGFPLKGGLKKDYYKSFKRELYFIPVYNGEQKIE
jgi:hypothetical protein